MPIVERTVPASDPTLDFAMELLRRCSVTPEDAGCQQLVAERLAGLGCTVRSLPFGEVANLWLTHGSGAPLLTMLGHTDVVPPGPVEDWDGDPFEPRLRDGLLYGRGAADMKGSVAAMVTALERFLRARPGHRGTAALLLTSDEEGRAVNGTRRVAQWLRERGQIPHYCLVGEPSSRERLGDTVRNGRRGSLSARLSIAGTLGHVAYPERAANPIHAALPALAELCARRWGGDDADFPPASFQLTRVQAGTGADNVIPSRFEASLNFRYPPAVSRQELQEEVARTLASCGLRCELDWHCSGEPFLTRGGKLLEAVRDALREHGVECETATDGGTSDGRFIAPLGAEVIELGPTNRTIHQANEHVRADDLALLSSIYEDVLKRLLDD